MSYHLAHHLANLGHEVVFISHHPYFIEEQVVKKEKGKISIFSWPTTKRPTSIKDFLWYSKIHLKYKPDIIIGHFVGSNITILGSKILSLGKVKSYEYYHSLTDQLLADQEKITLRQKLLFFRKKIFYKLFCDVIVCPSELAKLDLKHFYSISNALVLVNPMIDRFNGKEVIVSDSIIISYLGRLDPSKGVTDLIEAYKIYINKVKNSKIILNIAGSGRQEGKIIELVKNNGTLHYLGGLAYSEIDNYLNNSHFAIIPSKFDNLPTVGLESIMNKTPLLISRTTGLTDYLIDGKECFKFEPNIDAMVSLFERVENNFNLYPQMSSNARATFLEKFSINTYCNSISNLIL
jgi:glycosyltransferase involved in cell wall biosynthesis